MADDPNAAPAQSETEPTALESAIVADDYTQFEAAQRAELQGKPLDTPDEPVKESAKATIDRPISKRQQAINDSIRTASEKAVADAVRDKDAEIARLKAERQAPIERPVVKAVEEPAKPVPVAARDTFPNFADYLAKNPDATLETWMDARDEWRDDQRTRTAAQQAEAKSATDAEIARLTKAHDLITERTKDDKDYIKNLNPRLLEIETLADAGRNGRPTGPANVIAEELFKSDAFLSLLDHFTAHPDALARLEAMPDHLKTLSARQRATEHTRWIVREIGKIEASLHSPVAATESPKPKTVTTAPRPPADLGKRSTENADPIASAVKADDYAAFEAAERAKLAASRQASRR